MKILQCLAAAVLVAAGLVLVEPVWSQVQVKGAAFVPTRFTVTDAGTVGKPDVVLVPGLASSRSVWDVEAKLLTPNYRLHILQVDGFAGAPVGGNASGPMLTGIVTELHEYIEGSGMKPVVIGHSMGGLLTLMLADKYPADVRKMVIVDALPFYALVFNPTATVETMKPQADMIKQQMLAMPDDQFAAMQPMMAAQLVTNKDGQKKVAESSMATNRNVFVMAMYEDLQTDLRADVGKVRTPTLLLYPLDPTTQKDAAKVDALYRNAYAAMPNLTMVRVDGSRHFIMYDQPEKMDAAMEQFLK